MAEEIVHGIPSPKIVIGVFSTLRDAEVAVVHLEQMGLSTDEISVISSSDVVKQYFHAYRPDAEPSDWKAAAVTGGSAGAVLAGLTSVTALATGAGIPVVVAGGLASLLTGGVVGGLAGAMVERGFETEAADYYELAVADGRTLIAVDLTDRNDEAKLRPQINQIFTTAGVEPVELRKAPDLSS